jgi:type IV pilus biogenesis protein CpaD/CtpE
MMRTVVLMACMGVQLGGCADEAANFGRSPPIALTTFNREVSISFKASRFSERSLRRNVDVLAQGDLQSVRARIVAASFAQIKDARQALIGMGIDPARITESTALRARNVTIFLSRTVAVTNDCAAAAALAFPDDPSPSLLSLSYCTQNNNLAAMIVDPADLVAPPALGHADGAYLANGVRSWRDNRRTPLPSVTTSAGVDPSGGGAVVPNSSLAPTTAPVVSAPSTTAAHP